MTVNQRRDRKAHVTNAGSVPIPWLDRKQGFLSIGSQPRRERRLRCLGAQPVHPERSVSRWVDRKVAAGDGVMEEVALPDFGIQPAAGRLRDIILWANWRQRWQGVSGDVLLERGHDCISGPANESRMKHDRLPSMHQLSYGRQEAALLTVLAVAARVENTHDVTAGAEEAVG